MKKLLMLVLAFVLVGVGTWAVAMRVESPDQVAARAEPPDPAPIDAQLTQGYLNGPVSLSVAAQREQVVTVKAGANLTGVVTSVERSPGDMLEAGSVLMRVNGRPLFVLTGAFALYRDIQPGDTGDDVAAVQAALVSAGLPVGKDKAGVYGPGTQSAVRKLYKRAGYEAPETATPPAAGDSEVDEGGIAPASTPVPTTPLGPLIVRSEALMVANLPATIGTVAAVGTTVATDTDLVTLGAGQVLLTATLPTTSLGALAVGAQGSLVDDSGAPVAAAIIGIQAGSSEGDSVVALSIGGGAVTVGNSYVVTVDNPAAESGASLLAPIAAVVTRAGSSFVYVRDSDSYREVPVNVLGSVGGIAAIEPVSADDQLSAGTDVRVG